MYTRGRKNSQLTTLLLAKLRNAGWLGRYKECNTSPNNGSDKAKLMYWLSAFKITVISQVGSKIYPKMSWLVMLSP